MRKPFILLVSGLLALVLVTAACGGSSDSDSNKASTAAPTATSTAASGAATGTVQAGTPQATATQSGSGGDARGAFTKLAADAQKANYKVVFDINFTSEGQPVKGTMTWYSKRPKFRLDMEATQDNEQVKFTFIGVEDASYLCSSETRQSACLKLPSGQGESNTPENFGAQLKQSLDDLSKVADNAQIRDAGKRSVAGQQASCFEVKSTANTGLQDGLVCLNNDGIPLFIEARGSDGGTIQAKEFTKSVSDDDFKPPYPVQSLPIGQPTPSR